MRRHVPRARPSFTRLPVRSELSVHGTATSRRHRGNEDGQVPLLRTGTERASRPGSERRRHKLGRLWTGSCDSEACARTSLRGCVSLGLPRSRPRDQAHVQVVWVGGDPRLPCREGQRDRAGEAGGAGVSEQVTAWAPADFGERVAGASGSSTLWSRHLG